MQRCNGWNPPWFLQGTPVIPNIYWNVESAEQRWKEICVWLAKLTDYAEQTGTDVSELKKLVEALEAEFEKFRESGFADYYEKEIEEWINANFATIMQKLVGIGIYFGLTSTGYFCAYIPDSWSDIVFDTGAVYGTKNYGRLILKYQVDGDGVIDNEYDYHQLRDVMESAIKAAIAGSAGNGLEYSDADEKLFVPLGEHLRYTTTGIDVPEADTVTAGVVKVTHRITNDSTDGVAASPDAVYQFAEPSGK